MVWLITLFLLILFSAPLIFQIIAGNKSKNKKIKLAFSYVVLISISSQLLTAFWFHIRFSDNPHHYDWGLGWLFVMTLCAILLLFNLIIVLIQTIRYRERKRKYTNEI